MNSEIKNSRWERRFSKRVSYRRSGIYSAASMPPKHPAHTMNLSESGLFINTAQPLEPGTRLQFIIRDNGCYLKVEGIVTRNMMKEESIIFTSESGMGVRFLKPNDMLLKIYRDQTTTERENKASPQ